MPNPDLYVPTPDSISDITSTTQTVTFDNFSFNGNLNLSGKGSSAITLSGNATFNGTLGPVANKKATNTGGTLNTGTRQVVIAAGASLSFLPELSTDSSVTVSGTTSYNEDGGSIQVYGHITFGYSFVNMKSSKGSHVIVEDSGIFEVLDGETKNRGYQNKCYITVNAGGTFLQHNGNVINWDDITVSGTAEKAAIFTFNGSGGFKNGASKDKALITVGNYGLFTVSSLSNEGLSSDGSLAATIKVDAGGTFIANGKVSNASVKESTYGGITVNGSFTAKGEGAADNIAFANSGTLTVNSTGTLCAGGYLNSDDEFVATSGSSVTNSGTVEMYGTMHAAAVINNKTLTVSGEVSSPATFNAARLNNSTTASVASFTHAEVSISGNLSNNNDSAKASFTDSTVQVDGNVSNVGKAANNSGMSFQDSVVVAGGSFSNSGAINFTDTEVTIGGNNNTTLILENKSGGSINVTSTEADAFTVNGAMKNAGSLTISGTASSPITFSAVSLNNNETASAATFTDAVVSFSGTVSNSGKTASGGGMTVQDSVFEAGGTFTNSGTLTVGTTAEGKSVSFQSGAITNSGTLTVEKASGTSAIFTAVSLNNSTASSAATFTDAVVSFSGTVSNAGSLTVSGSDSSPAIFSAVSLNNSAASSVASFTDAEVLFSGTVSNSGKTASDGGMTIQDSTFVAGGTFTNSGTLSITDVSAVVGATDNALEIFSNTATGTVAFSSTGAQSSTLIVNGALKNVGTLTVTTGSASGGGTASITVIGAVTNSNAANDRAVITVDAGSSFSASSFVNNNGRFEFIYKQTGTNITIDSFNNQGGIIQIDVTEYLDNMAFSPTAVISGITLSSADQCGTITFIDTKSAERPDALSKISCSINANNEIVLGPLPIFVNARWTNTESIPATVTYNGRTYNTGTDVQAFGNVQDAIDAAGDGATIVFYSMAEDQSVEDFKFYTQGLVTVNKDLYFEVNTKTKAVKFDSMKIASGCTAEFRNGLYSMEDFLDNDGTLKIVENTRFNGELIKNVNGTITLDKTSRLVAASIDAGVVEVRAGFVYNNLRWIEQPYAAKIGDKVTIKLVYPKTDSAPPQTTGDDTSVRYETRIIDGVARQAVVETINPGDQVYAKIVGDQYICYGTAAHHGALPDGDGWNSFYAATEYGGLQLIDDEFDLNEIGSTGTYSTAAIYVNNSRPNPVRTATFTATWVSSSRLTLNKDDICLVRGGAGSSKDVGGGYSCTVAVGDTILTGNLVYKNNTWILDFAPNSLPEPSGDEQYTIVLADPKYTKRTASSGHTLTLNGTGLEDGAYRYSIRVSDSLTISGDCTVSGGAVTITNNSLANNKDYTVTLTSASVPTITVNSQDLAGATDENHKVTVSGEFEDNFIAYDSFMGAMNSIYVRNHMLGKSESGMVIRLQEGTYTEGVFDGTETTPIALDTDYNVIVEPDRWQDADGQWHYDDVSLILGGTFGKPNTANLMTFYKLKNMTIDNFTVGRNAGTAENSVLNFVDIENLEINIRMKPQGAATVRILNSNVISKKHFSVAGGTLIIENSNVKLTGANTFGSLSTENNYVGSGTVIIRNSVFELEGSTSGSTPVVVNLKLNAEFTISGTCTVNGVFTNLNETNGSNTYISFRDAILDENTVIRGKDDKDVGAALRFEGYNVLDGTTVEQFGNQDMTIKVGSTLDMTGGASISVGGDVDVSNCGNISLDNASISAGSFTNQGSLTLTDGSEISLVHDHTVNSGTDPDETSKGPLTMEVTFDEFYNGKTVVLTVTNSSGQIVEVLDANSDLGPNTVLVQSKIVDDKTVYYAVIKRPGTDVRFAKNHNYTITHDGYFVNSENGTFTAQLQSDGSLGITTADGTPVPIENTGTIYIDLSKTDMPEEPYIILDGLSGSGEVIVIGGGGEYKTDTPTGGDHDVPHINLFTPSTVTIYVNGEWSDENLYRKGRNVGSYTYFGYNAFEDNCGDTVRDLKFAANTTKVIYYGGSTYGAWILPRVAETITTETGTYTRYSDGDVKKGSITYYAWKKEVGEDPVVVTCIYTQTMDADALEGAQTYTKDGDNFDPVTGDAATVSSLSLLNSITLTTMGSMSTAKMTVKKTSITLTAGSARYISLEVRDADRKLLEKQSISVAAGQTGFDNDLVFYSSILDADVAGYTVSIVDNGTTTQLNQTNDWSLVNVSGDRDRDTATMGPMTVGESQTVTVSGATMSLKDGATDSVMNSGTLKIETGESAKLVIPVAESATTRDVKVVVKIGSNEEHHTVQAAAGASSVTVESKSFAPGQEYQIKGTDTHQYSAVDNALTVDVVGSSVNRTIDVVVRNAEGVKFSFTNVLVDADTTTVSLNPATGLDSTSATVTVNVSEDEKSHFSGTHENGILTLTVSGTVSAQRVNVYVQNTVADVIYRFDYTFDIAAQGDTASTTYTVSTRLSSKGYYYVETTEPDVTVVSEVNGISGAYISAEDVTNSGSIVVASQDTAYGAPRRAAKLVLDVDRNDNASRWIEVVTGGNTYSLFVEKGAETAELESENFTVGTEYSDIRIKDAYSAAITASNTKTLTLTGLSSSDNVIRPDGPIVRTLKATVRDGVVVVDTYTITEISNGTAVISDSRLTAGKKYTVELSDEKTVVATAETLSVFDSTGTVTNNSVITVTDATFNAGTLTNESTGTITLTNSQLNVSGTLTNNASYTTEPPADPNRGIFMDIDSLITAGSIVNNGTITIDATAFDPDTTDMKKVIDLDSNCAIDIDLRKESSSAASDIGILYNTEEFDYWIVAANRSILYVNEEWATDENGLAHKIGDNVGDKLYYGYNAFGSFTEAYAETLKVNPYKLNGEQQTITTIEVYGPTAEESAKDALLFFGDNGKVVSNLTITVHAPSETAAAVIPFLNDDYGINISPANGVTITIDSGITIQTDVSATLEDTNDQCSGTVYLNYQRTSGTIELDGAIDSAREIKIYGKTDVSNTGSLKAATLLWINSGGAPTPETRTVTVTGTGGNWTSAPQVSAENILFSSGKLEITDSKVASKGLVFGYDDGVAAGNILLESNLTDWTLNNIGTQTVGGSAKGTYQFSNGSIMVKGDDANTINNAGTVNPGEVAIGSGVTLELANNTLTVQKGDAEDSTGAILNSGTIRTDLNSLITAESIDNTNGTITVDVAGYVSTGGMQKVIDLKTDDLYELIASDSSTVNFTVGGEAASGYYLAYDHSAYDYWVTDAPQTTLYVNEDWASGSYNYGDYIGTVDEINRYYGYNAFSSFVDALTVASDLTINNANFADGITIDVESDITHDLIPAGEGSLNLVFQGAIKVNGHGRTVTVYGDRYLRLGAATNTTSFVFDPDFVFNYQQVGSVDTGKYGLLFGTSPANSLGSVTMNGTFTSGNRLQAITGSLTLNEDVTANTYVYLGSADMTIEKPVESQIITFTGDAIVNSDATLTTPANGNILIYGELTSGDDPSIDVLIDGNGNSLYETIPQVTTGSLVLTEGSLETRYTHIELKSNLSFCDDYDRYTEDGVDYTGKVVLLSKKTLWDIGGDINVRFFTDQDYILGSYATLTFSESTVNVGGNVINAAYSTTSGQDSDTYLDEAPAMTIQLVGTYMEVNGRLENDGSIEVKDSTVSAGSLDNDGTFTVKGESELHIDELDGTITLTDGGSTTPTTLKDTDIYGKTGTGGKLVAQGDLDFAATTSNILSDIELDATGHTVKVLYGTFKVDAASQIKAANFTNSGTFIVDAADFTYGEDEIKNVKIIDAETSVTLGTPGTNYEVINTPSGKQAFLLQDDAAKDVYLTNQDQTVQYVNTTYSASKDVDGNGGHFYGYNAESSIADAVTAAGTSGTIVVTGGEFGTSNAPTFEGVETTISGGNFSTSVCGGELVTDGISFTLGEAVGEKDTLSLTIDGGCFNKIVFAGDRVNSDTELTRIANTEMTISGGDFRHSIAGAMALTDADGYAVLDGNATLTIYGGMFNDINNKGWIYGGCIASTKTVGGSTTITGNATVRIDTSEKNSSITVSNVVAGSYGAGTIEGNTNLVLTGAKDITATGEIWGGCSSDKYSGTYKTDSHNHKLTTTVAGSRILSFTGFSGDLTTRTNKIRGFSDVVVEGNSDATVKNYSEGSVDLSDVENWIFEKGSSLTGNFINDFYGDTLTLKGFDDAETGSYSLMIDNDPDSESNDIFHEFANLKTVQVKLTDRVVGLNYDEDAGTWHDSGSLYVLAIDNIVRSEQTCKAMQLTIA